MLNTLVCVAQSNKRIQTSQEKFGATDLTNDNLSVLYNYNFMYKMLVTLVVYEHCGPTHCTFHIVCMYFVPINWWYSYLFYKIPNR